MNVLCLKDFILLFFLYERYVRRKSIYYSIRFNRHLYAISTDSMIISFEIQRLTVRGTNTVPYRTVSVRDDIEKT